MQRTILGGVCLVALLALPSNALAAPTPKPTPTQQATPTRVATHPSPSTTPLPRASATPTPLPTTPEPTPATDAAATTTSQPAEAPGVPASQAEAPEAASSRPSALPDDDAFSVWHGIVRSGGAYRRSAPNAAAPVEEELDPGTPVRVDAWVAGSMLYPDVITWAQVDAADGGGYIFGGSLQGVLPPAAPPAPEEMQGVQSSWVDVNLTLNVVTAYVDGEPVKSMLTSPGRPGYSTDTGVFAIRSKFVHQNMSGPGYFVPGVPDVQYFYGAEALHGRYWTLPQDLGVTSADIGDDGLIQASAGPTTDTDGVNTGIAFGIPSSHGCLGLAVDDALWLYQLTPPGTLVDVHY